MQLLGPNSLAQTGFPGDTGRLRSWARAPRLDALVRRADGDGVRIELDEPAFGIAPGQAAVTYDGDLVVGASTIATAS